MGKREKIYSKHHLLPTSRDGANISGNIISIPDKDHRAIHQLFANQMIAEQLLTMVDISSKALRDDVKKWLIKVLTSKDIKDPYERYKDECIK